MANKGRHHTIFASGDTVNARNLERAQMDAQGTEPGTFLTQTAPKLSLKLRSHNYLTRKCNVGFRRVSATRNELLPVQRFFGTSGSQKQRHTASKTAVIQHYKRSKSNARTFGPHSTSRAADLNVSSAVSLANVLALRSELQPFSQLRRVSAINAYSTIKPHLKRNLFDQIVEDW